MKPRMNMPQNNGKFRQFITAVIVNLSTISFGIACGWLSPIMLQLRSNHPPVGNTPFTEDQISWINSIPSIGGLIIIPFCGIVSERIGRKKFAIYTGIPHMICWLLTFFAQNPTQLYLARVAFGMGGAMTLFIVPLYISEFASTDIRGILGSLLVLAINVGILFTYVAGAYLSYRLFASLCLIVPTVYIAAVFFFVPETPVYLARRDRQSQAHKSLMFYRGNNRALVEQELIELRCQTNVSNTPSKTVSLREFFGDRATRKALIISMGLIAAQALSGIAAMTAYAQTIFKLAGSSISSEVASILVAVVMIAGSQVSTLLMERAGRRLLSLVSCLGMAVSLSIVGSYFYLQRNHYQVNSIAWLPMAGVSGYIVAFCLGVGPVPFVLISELFRLDVTSFATTLCFVFYFLIGFTAIKTFDWAMQVRGPDGCFFMLASFCAVSFIFCYCLLPETKGREREDIVDELAGIRKSRSEEMKMKEDESTDVKLLADVKPA